MDYFESFRYEWRRVFVEDLGSRFQGNSSVSSRLAYIYARFLLVPLLVQAAHTVARSKDNYLGALFRRLAARRGKKRAAVAVARSMLVIAYHMLRNGTHYVELGADYFDKLNHQHLQRRLVNRLSQLGYQVTLEPVAV